MKSLLSQIIYLAVLLVAVTSCSQNTKDKGHSSHEEHKKQPTNRVDIPASVRTNLGISFAKVSRRNVANTIRVPGAFELEPLARHEYRVVLPGHVAFKVDQFDPVEPGTLLYRLHSHEWLELQALVVLAKANLKQAREKFEAADDRLKSLREAGFKRAELEASAVELKADIAKREAELSAAQADLRHMSSGSSGEVERLSQLTERVDVRATESGVVESLAVTDGSLVEESSLILTTVNPEMVRFRAVGLQSDLSKFMDVDIVNIVPPQGGIEHINDSINAEFRMGLSADPQQRTIELFASPMEERDWILPGVSAFMEITTESTDGLVLAIPRSAVVKDGIKHVFFKRDPNNANKAIRVEADLGVDDGRWVEIQSDLGPNDEVVLNGAYELMLATAQSGTAQKGGHFHADGTFHAEDH